YRRSSNLVRRSSISVPRFYDASGGRNDDGVLRQSRAVSSDDRRRRAPPAARWGRARPRRGEPEAERGLPGMGRARTATGLRALATPGGMTRLVRRINLLTALALLVSGLLQPLAAAQGVVCARTH